MYTEILHDLFQKNQTTKAEYKLEPFQKLLNAIGNPQHRYPTIHIAGTNGKGSVVLKIAAAFEMAGHRTGMYTSPHISCYRERIQINRQMIPENDVILYMEYLNLKAKDLHLQLSFFEFTTALAFLYFADKQVDIAIIETGLGGRLDATNVLNPLMSIITSISLDHTAILGNTLLEIGKEKAGILRPGIPVVVGPSVPLASLGNHSPIIQSNDPSVNAIAKTALEALSWRLPSHVIDEALKLFPPCRFERILRNNRTAILDVAHNPASIELLFQKMEQTFPDQAFNAIFGLSKTKDLAGCLHKIPKSCPLIFTESFHDRSFSAEHLFATAQALGFEKIQICKNPYEAAKKHLGALTLIFGTFFIMRDVRQALGIQELCDPIDMNETMLQTPDK